MEQYLKVTISSDDDVFIILPCIDAILKNKTEKQRKNTVLEHLCTQLSNSSPLRMNANFAVSSRKLVGARKLKDNYRGPSLLDSVLSLHVAYPKEFTVSLTPGLNKLLPLLKQKPVAWLHAHPNCFPILPLFYKEILFCLNNEEFPLTQLLTIFSVISTNWIL